MYQIDAIVEKLKIMFNQAAVSKSTRKDLISYLSQVAEVAPDTAGGEIAETLIDNICRYQSPKCSDRQAKAVAYTAYEHFIWL